MTIHSEHPFATPDDAARRLRGRLGGAVALVTSGEAGLTVSSLMIASGEPARVLMLLDPDSSLVEALEATRRGVLHLLSAQHQGLAEAFAGQMPAPGGPFRLAEFEQTPHGPRLADASTYAMLAVEDAREVGWSTLVTCTLEAITIGPDTAGGGPLQHRRGRYEHVRDS